MPRTDTPRDLLEVADTLERALSKLRFAAPVTHVYQPLRYARALVAD